MKAENCRICNRPPRVDVYPASKDGGAVGVVVQCYSHLQGQVSIYGVNFGCVHRAALVGWNDYQSNMAAEIALEHVR